MRNKYLFEEDSGGIALIGEAGAGKDSFIISLLSLKGADGNVDVQMDRVLIDKENGTTSFILTNPDDWPKPTENVEFKSFRIIRKNKKNEDGRRAFFMGSQVLNGPGIFFENLRTLDIDVKKLVNDKSGAYAQSIRPRLKPGQDIDEIRKMLIDLKRASMYIVMLDIAHLLTDFPANDPIVNRKDRDLFDSFNRLFDYLSGNTGFSKPVAFCITKIDGKFTDSQIGSIEIAEKLEEIEHYIVEYELGNQEFPTEKAAQFVKEVNFNWKRINEYGDLEELPSMHSSDPNTWTPNIFSMWIREKRDQLQQSLLNNERTSALRYESETQLRRRISSHFPAISNLMETVGNHKIFAISATGSDIIPKPKRRAWNVEKVLNYILEQLESMRQSNRLIPDILRSLSRSARSVDQQLYLQNEEADIDSQNNVE